MGNSISQLLEGTYGTTSAEVGRAILIGLAYSLILGHIFVKLVSEAMWTKLLDKAPDLEQVARRDNWQTPIVGAVERALYFSCYLLGQYSFVGLWLMLKVAGQWRRWNEGIGDTETNERKLEGRSIYYVFLVGSTLSLAFGVVGGMLALCLMNSKLELDVPTCGLVFYAPTGLGVFSIIITLWMFMGGTKLQKGSNWIWSKVFAVFNYLLRHL
jgi:hypothetical protein